MERALSARTLNELGRIVRRLGLHSVIPLGTRLVKHLPIDYLFVDFDGLRISGAIENRCHLYQVAAGQMEPFMSAQFARSVKAGMVVLDIGAHLGYYSLLAAKAGAKVYAFEPDARTYRHLVRNISINGLADMVTAVPKAVSDGSGMARFFMNDNPGHSSLFDMSGGARNAIVERISLDEFLDETVSVDVIKMDIQGAELHALSGMERTIARASTRLTMFVECWPPGLRMTGSTAGVLIERLRDFGFTVTVIDEQKRCLAPVDPDIESMQYVNLYCRRHESKPPR